MAIKHNVKRQLNFLRQCFADGKRPVCLLIGAGCPTSIQVDGNPIIPDIDGLTNLIIDKMSVSEKCKESFETLKSHFAEDGVDKPNIECILSHIRSLITVVGKGTVRGLSSAQLNELDSEICENIENIMNRTLPDEVTAYHKVASWVGGIYREHPVEIFTTNYDVLMEQALEDNRVLYFDGFVGARRAVFSPHSMSENLIPKKWNRLWKLHGSINWYMDKKGIIYRGAKAEGETVRIIHPSHLKYSESRQMPYFAMIERLRGVFQNPSPVIVTNGYSFKDQHINEVVLEGLRSNPNAMVFGLLFGKLDNYPEAIALASRRSNLSLLAEDCAVIVTSRAEWEELPESDILIHSESLSTEVDEVRDPSGTSGARKKMIFKLGDFTCFGSYLSEVVCTSGINEVLDEK